MTRLSSATLALADDSHDVWSAIEYRHATVDDAGVVVDFMRRYPEISFCDWQDRDVTRSILQLSSTVSVMALRDGRVIGAILAGIIGTRGTVNHIAVDSEYRTLGVGTELVSLCLKEFRVRGCRRVFLFVDDNNPLARSFWFRHGFAKVPGETTLERDL